jgi:DNA-binding MarR family transcriptional regulator
VNRSPFAKIGPEPIIDDPRMTLEHLRVYWALASSVPKGTDRCKVGQRLVSRIVKRSQATVSRRISDLVAWGHLEVDASEHGKRARYILKSVAFQVKPKESIGKIQRSAAPRRSETWKARMCAEANDERAKEIG